MPSKASKRRLVAAVRKAVKKYRQSAKRPQRARGRR